jgi:hypothetical protein
MACAVKGNIDWKQFPNRGASSPGVCKMGTFTITANPEPASVPETIGLSQKFRRRSLVLFGILFLVSSSIADGQVKLLLH